MTHVAPDDWPRYWGTPSIATAAAGARAMSAIGQAALDVALKVLGGVADAPLVRVADQTAANPEVAKPVAASLETRAAGGAAAERVDCPQPPLTEIYFFGRDAGGTRLFRR